MSINALFIIDSFSYGGTERQLVALIEGLDKRPNFKAHICTLKPSEGLFNELTCKKHQLSVSRLLHPKSISKFRILIDLLRKWDIHIVHTFFQDPFAVGAFIKRFHPFFLIGSFRDMGFWRTPLENFKMRMSYPAFDGFIANSQTVKNHFVLTDGLSPDRIKVIYNGYNCASNPLADPIAKSEIFTVGIVANFNRPVKRLQDFLKTAEIMHSRNDSVQFVVVGSVANYYSDVIKAAKNKMGDCLKFIGSVDNPIDYIKDFDVGIITSETEGFCNAIIEYMASGLPVVVTDGGGNKELVENGVNGFLVPVGHPEKMADKIAMLQNNREMRIQIGRTNRKLVESKYHMKRMINEHETYYKQIIFRRSAVNG